MGMDDMPLYKAIQADKNPQVRRMLYAGLRGSGAAWTAPLLGAGLEDTLDENVAICASGLAALGYRPAVPRLVGILKNAPPDAGQPFGDHNREVGVAVAKLSGLPFDFGRRTHPVGNRHAHADVIDNCDDLYRRECVRVLQWWDEFGSKQKWVDVATP